jgi:hypothetical protein
VLLKKQDVVKNFVNDIVIKRYRRRRKGEEPITVKMIGSESIIGLGGELIV